MHQPNSIRIRVLNCQRQELAGAIELDRKISIGRSNQCDIYVDDCFESVSRHHARIEMGRDGVHFVDDGSSNGSYSQGKRIDRMPLVLDQDYEFLLGKEKDGVLIEVRAHFKAQMHFGAAQPGASAPTLIVSVHDRAKARASLQQRDVIFIRDRASAGKQNSEGDRFVSSTERVAADVGGVDRRHATPAFEANIPTPVVRQRALVEKRVYRALYVVQGSRQPEDVYEKEYEQDLYSLVVDILRAEAPISHNLLARRVAPYWGLQKSSAKLRERILKVLERSGTDEFLQQNESGLLFFYRREEPPDAIVFYRIPTSDVRTRRNPEDLPIPEIRNAAEEYIDGVLTNENFEGVARRAAGLFGCSRLGAEIKKRMEVALGALVVGGV